jgi:hypothetical protein
MQILKTDTNSGATAAGFRLDKSSPIRSSMARITIPYMMKEMSMRQN